VLFGGIYRDMINLRPFPKPHQVLSESSPWDGDPKAPWYTNPSEPEAKIKFNSREQLFEIQVHVPDAYAILKKKGDGTLWVLDTRDMLDSEGEFDDYIFYVNYMDMKDKAEDMEAESYLNIATDLYNEGKYLENPEADIIEMAESEERLFKLTDPLVAWLIEDSLYLSKKRDRKYYSQSKFNYYRDTANYLGRAFPHVDI